MLDIDPYTILWTVVNLLVLYLLMRKFLFGPVNAILDGRAKAIEDGLTQARQQQEEAQQLHSQYEAEIAQSKDEASQIIAQAKAQSEALYQRTLADAQAEAEQELSDAWLELADARAELDDGWAEYYDGGPELSGSQAEAKKLLEENRERNLRDRENMLRSVRQEVAQLAVVAAEKVAVDSNQAIDSFLQEAGDQK